MWSWYSNKRTLSFEIKSSCVLQSSPQGWNNSTLTHTKRDVIIAGRLPDREVKRCTLRPAPPSPPPPKKKKNPTTLYNRSPPNLSRTKKLSGTQGTEECVDVLVTLWSLLWSLTLKIQDLIVNSPLMLHTSL